MMDAPSLSQHSSQCHQSAVLRCKDPTEWIVFTIAERSIVLEKCLWLDGSGRSQLHAPEASRFGEGPQNPCVQAETVRRIDRPSVRERKGRGHVHGLQNERPARTESLAGDGEQIPYLRERKVLDHLERDDCARWANRRRRKGPKLNRLRC